MFEGILKILQQKQKEINGEVCTQKFIKCYQSEPLGQMIFMKTLFEVLPSIDHNQPCLYSVS